MPSKRLVSHAAILVPLVKMLASCVQVAVALGASVYMWSASSGAITQLMSTASEDDYITSLAWAADGKHISVGTYSSQVPSL